MKIALAVLGLLAVASFAGAATYILPEELKKALQQKLEVIIIDIQPAAEFEQHHLPGSIETNAFPAKTFEEKLRLDQIIPAVKASEAPVIIVCPRGKGGAKNSYEYLKSKGIEEERLKILEGGMAGWTFNEYLKQGR